MSNNDNDMDVPVMVFLSSILMVLILFVFLAFKIVTTGGWSKPFYDECESRGGVVSGVLMPKAGIIYDCNL